MCTLVLYFQVFSEYPIVIGANRDELLTRPSAPPTLLGSNPWVYGGQDLLAGGTWLGINEYGLAAAILNRQAPGSPDPRRRSRGLLCLDVLQHSSASTALQSIFRQQTVQYDPFSLVIADHAVAYVVYPAPYGKLQVQLITPGVHLLTNLSLNDSACPRVTRFSSRFQAVGQNGNDHFSLPILFIQMQRLLSHHEPAQDPRANLCLHFDNYGTCSSTLLAYSQPEQRYTYYFAPGPPCQVAYSEVRLPLGARASHPPSTT
jgi:uncharacterized protein with NRDE domain